MDGVEGLGEVFDVGWRNTEVAVSQGKSQVTDVIAGEGAEEFECDGDEAVCVEGGRSSSGQRESKSVSGGVKEWDRLLGAPDEDSD